MALFQSLMGVNQAHVRMITGMPSSHLLRRPQLRSPRHWHGITRRSSTAPTTPSSGASWRPDWKLSTIPAESDTSPSSQ
jgi:hypothetical protein